MVTAAAQPMTDGANDIQPSEIKEIFMLFDKNSDGFVHT